MQVETPAPKGSRSEVPTTESSGPQGVLTFEENRGINNARIAKTGLPVTTDVRAVFVTIPRDKAQSLARLIVENRLAACVNIVPQIESFYWWEGKVQTDDEALLIIKTTTARFDALQIFVLDHHPYDLPEIIALPIDTGLDAYLKWVIEEVG